MGISNKLHNFYSMLPQNYISPTIIEERQLNVATMDVFSRLMMDRIIFLGVLFMMMLLILFKLNFFSLSRQILKKIFKYI